MKKRSPLAAAALLVTFAAPSFAAPEVPGIDLPLRKGLIGALFTVRTEPSNTQSLVIAAVLANSPAFRKLHAGDVVGNIDGTPVKDPIASQRQLRAAEPGHELRLQVLSGSSAKVVSLTVKELTPEWERRIGAAEEQMQRAAAAEVEGRLAFLPQALCSSGARAGEFLGLTVLAGVPTAAGIEAAQPQCSNALPACAPLALLKQTAGQTTIKAGGKKYRLGGDWRHLTFDTASDCQAAVSSASAAANSSTSHSPSWSASSQ
jgi:hypothetical protein